MKQIITAGIDIGTGTIRVAVCGWEKGKDEPQILALAKRPSKGLRRGYIINFDEAVSAIKETVTEAERLAKVKIKRIFVGVGGVTVESKTADGTVVVSRADLEIGKTDLKRVVEEVENNLADMNNREILHRFPIGYKVDGKRVLGRPEEMRGEKLEAKVLFITCSRQHLKDFVRAVEEAGLVVEGVIASPLASASVLLTKLHKTSGCVLANIGSQTTSIAVFEEGLPLSLHIFPIGSVDITNDIALGFKIPLEDAERLKRGEVEPAGPKRKLDEIIEARVSDVFEFIELHLKKIGRNGLLPAGIIITGGGSGISNIEDLARAHFKLPARLASSAKVSAAQKEGFDPSWSVAYGLCLYDYGHDLGSDFLGDTVNVKDKVFRWIKEFMP